MIDYKLVPTLSYLLRYFCESKHAMDNATQNDSNFCNHSVLHVVYFVILMQIFVY